MNQALRNILLNPRFIALEFLLLCILTPAYIIYTKSAPFMFSFLWGAALYGFFILRYVYKDHLRQLWKWKAVNWENMKPILLRWVLACIAMTVFIYWYDPDRMFKLFLERPYFLPVLVVVYTLISALPQEFIFCSFFFERYKRFFGEGMKMVVASAIIFAYAHVLYINPVAPTLSLIAGLIFALTYLKTKSLALVTIEHGLYGSYLFVVGLGWYFYGGSVVANG
ncbi:MAG: type II CAAX prenyl endopeptidase Rce1 family protein [Alphaproteobacteria bacterium]